MKSHVIRLHPRKHRHFLDQERQDPVTGEFFESEDEIVICAGCKSAFLKESWTYLGAQHCGQIRTLADLPGSKRLRLRNDFIKFSNGLSARPAALRKRVLAFVADTWVSLILSLLIMLPFSSLYFWLRDTQYGVGKGLFNLKVVRRKTGHTYSVWESVRRNFWFGLFLGMPHFTFVFRQLSEPLGEYLSMSWGLFLLMAIMERKLLPHEGTDYRVIQS